MIRIPGAAILGLVAILSIGSAFGAAEPDELMPGRIGAGGPRRAVLVSRALLHPTRVWTGPHRPSRPLRLPHRDRRGSPSFSGKFRADVIPGRTEPGHTPV